VKKVLFICVHNAGRSQMATAFFNQMARGKAVALSAGTRPAPNVNPVVVEAMKEVGIDISNEKPKMLTFEMVDKSDIAITMGCTEEGDSCPAIFIPSEDWKLEDPAGKHIEEVRPIRDEIKRRVGLLIERLMSVDANSVAKDVE